MTVLPHIPTGYETALRPIWDRFGGFVDAISTLLAQQVEGELDIRALDGDLIGRIALADARGKFDNITWSLTTVASNNGGTGAVTSTYKKGSRPASWLSAAAAFHVDGFREYAEVGGDEGLRYLALHETSHVTLLGLRVQDACWRKHLKGGGAPDGYPDTPLWTYNEQVANEIVRTLAARLGVAVLAAPTFGSPPRRLKLGLKVA